MGQKEFRGAKGQEEERKDEGEGGSGSTSTSNRSSRRSGGSGDRAIDGTTGWVSVRPFLLDATSSNACDHSLRSPSLRYRSPLCTASSLRKPRSSLRKPRSSLHNPSLGCVCRGFFLCAHSVSDHVPPCCQFIMGSFGQKKPFGFFLSLDPMLAGTLDPMLAGIFLA